MCDFRSRGFEGAREGRETYNEVADDNLHNLGLQTGTATEGQLQQPDKKMAQRGADKGAIGGHLGHTRGEVVAMLVTILGEEGRDELLGAGEGAGGEHLGAQRVVLDLLDVGGQVTLGAGHLLATGQGGADGGGDRVLAAGSRDLLAGDGILDDAADGFLGVLCEPDRHGRCCLCGGRVARCADVATSGGWWCRWRVGRRGGIIWEL